LAPEILTECREILLGRSALKDFEHRDGADAEGDAAVQDLDKMAHGRILSSFQKIDQDGGIDEDHRALSFL
jgi:hypothetical protein